MNKFTISDPAFKPLPPKNRHKGGNGLSAALKAIEPGQCVEITGKSLHLVSSVATHVKKTTGQNYTCRLLDGGLIGVWRLK